MKNAVEITEWAWNIDNAIKMLKEASVYSFYDFNGHKLYSSYTEEFIYLKLFGKSKAQMDFESKKRNKDYELKQWQHKLATPKIIETFIKKGKILDVKYQEKWAEIVPYRVKDLYKGMELDAALEIVQNLQVYNDFKKAKEVVNNQGHSGMSYGLVLSIVAAICDNGKEFKNFCKD